MIDAVFVVTTSDVITYGLCAILLALAGLCWCGVRFEEWRERRRKGQP